MLWTFMLDIGILLYDIFADLNLNEPSETKYVL